MSTNPSDLRPDLTLVQKIAVLVSGIPIISNLLAAFHVFTITPAQQDALGSTLTWGGVLAVALIGGDAALRSARNFADAKIHAAAVSSNATAPGDDEPPVSRELPPAGEPGLTGTPETARRPDPPTS